PSRARERTRAPRGHRVAGAGSAPSRRIQSPLSPARSRVKKLRKMRGLPRHGGRKDLVCSLFAKRQELVAFCVKAPLGALSPPARPCLNGRRFTRRATSGGFGADAAGTRKQASHLR